MSNPRWVEAVPNFSEGRDSQVLAAISEAIASVSGVRLLHVDPGHDAHRSVFTFFGPPEVMVEAAFRGVQKSLSLIDMQKHHGVHPRIGAADLVPFVPWSGVHMEECVQLAKALANRLAETCKLPCYLYADAALRPQCRDLTMLRKGEYENFAAKMQEPHWHPDFGPSTFPLKSGVTAIGARNVLIAFNVTLACADTEIAKTIARSIRSSGYQGRPGLFTSLKAIGWFMEQYGRAQVSMNILDYHRSPIQRIFAEIERLATALGTRVTGSQLIGMIPREALMNGFDSIAEAMQALRLNDLAPFEPRRRVIELALTP